MKTILETPRLLLRELSFDDLNFIIEVLTHPEVMQFWPRTYTRDEAADWIKRQQARYARDGVGYWLAINKETGQPIGQVGVMVIPIDGADEWALGYIIHRPFWRMGYATEATTASRDYAFSKMGKGRVIAPIRPENFPSLGVARKLGMTLEKQTQYAGLAHLIFVTHFRA